VAQLSERDRYFLAYATEALREVLAVQRREAAATLRLQLGVPARVFAALREEFERIPEAITAAAREGERRRRDETT
jgi:hypothetical protein